MMRAYGERRRRELHEEGSVAAVAHHDPKGLKVLENAPEAAGEPPDPIGDYRRKVAEREARESGG